ncbi:restriction endonuclease [Methyloglobulus morosus KoM1]|uniref:Restriction endonuclease n=1 Tax=Methyloglobulus morosus KoM1 TaxID=1116472 RepID=V5C4Z4_9GAMM|nr:restriction endonuclease [Methyloglobulus morosus]ESS71808.1 restriction endonuclease [Methyloglobulus morosus KoM1]
MTKNTGKHYEAFVYELHQALNKDKRFKSVELDVKLPGPDGMRQIDVLLCYEVEHKELLTFIECRDFADRLGIKHVDGFHSKLMDFKAKGVLISRKGFSKDAKFKAKRVGITLCIASNVNEVLSTIDIQIPVALTSVETSLSYTSFSIETKKTGSLVFNGLKDAYTINGVYLPDVYRDELLAGKIQIPLVSSENEWKPLSIETPYTNRALKYDDGEPITGFDFSLKIKFTIRHFFGYLSDLPNIAALHNIELNEAELFIKTEDIPNMHTYLTEYKKYEDIPNMSNLRLISVSVPTVIDSGRLEIKRVR